MTARAPDLDDKNARHAGFTLIELAVVISIVALAAGLLLERMLFYREQAEKVAMEQIVGVLRSALHLQVASLLAKNGMNELPKLQGQNPMDWLAEKPTNYVGEYFAPKPQDITKGSWYFDLRQRNLIYSVQTKTHFKKTQGEPDLISFQVRIVSGKQGTQGQSDVEGVVLDPVVPYTWF
jgi:prepilin-type N-terminal cleavage/methylation domain-containing protein